ncbi:hypothetical protein MKX01_008186 [Papaver californicum]|nr:hypothetical protein MKX01_008186 [Papaver californicum]
MIKTRASNFLHSITTYTSSLIHHDNPNIGSTFFFSILILVSSILFSIKWIIKKKKQNQQLPPGPPQKFGPICKPQLANKLGIVISSPSLAKEVLKDHDVTFANRDVPVAGRAVTYGGQDIVWTPYGPEWRMLRKVCVREMLSNHSMDAVRRLVQHVHSKIGSPVDVGEQMFLTILNVITSMMWGGTLKGDGRTKIGADLDKLFLR